MEELALRSVWQGEPCPNPFRSPPSAALIEAQAKFIPPPGFNGRVGALVYESHGTLYACYATKPNRALPHDYRLLTEALLWPALSVAEMGDVRLVDGSGGNFSFRNFLTELLNQYSAKNASQGGRALAWRKGEMLYAMQEALKGPSVRLLVAFNQERASERLVALGEWHVGESEPHEMRRDGVFYAPLSSGRTLLNRLLVGHEIASFPQAMTREIPILYEDDALLIVDKPPRIPSVPSANEGVDCLSLLTQERGPLYDTHRLDMATSGIIVYAKTKVAQRRMQESFRARLVKKSYVAQLEGELSLEQGIIALPLGVNRLNRPTQCVLPPEAGGKPCETQFQVLESRRLANGENRTLVRLVPMTGRTHQLRVHCAHRLGLGVPIVGDVFYGVKGLLSESLECRLDLHAHEIFFPHPISGKSIQISLGAKFW